MYYSLLKSFLTNTGASSSKKGWSSFTKSTAVAFCSTFPITKSQRLCSSSPSRFFVSRRTHVLSSSRSCPPPTSSFAPRSTLGPFAATAEPFFPVMVTVIRSAFLASSALSSSSLDFLSALSSASRLGSRQPDTAPSPGAICSSRLIAPCLAEVRASSFLLALDRSLNLLSFSVSHSLSRFSHASFSLCRCSAPSSSFRSGPTLSVPPPPRPSSSRKAAAKSLLLCPKQSLTASLAAEQLRTDSSASAEAAGSSAPSAASPRPAPESWCASLIDSFTAFRYLSVAVLGFTTSNWPST
mmetsp:Transcript_6032/g.18249  ORF Transcript_6032/g.18249 Transcript_6032/m.18249 type:complete len:297 (+) Transcript_6032:22-912(+)